MYSISSISEVSQLGHCYVEVSLHLQLLVFVYVFLSIKFWTRGMPQVVEWLPSKHWFWVQIMVPQKNFSNFLVREFDTGWEGVRSFGTKEQNCIPEALPQGGHSVILVLFLNKGGWLWTREPPRSNYMYLVLERKISLSIWPFFWPGCVP
jgi:hypothetical protein